MTKNFEAFLKLDESKYRDKYIVIVKGKVVGSGMDIEKLLKTVRDKFPKQVPLVAKIPEEEILVL